MKIGIDTLFEHPDHPSSAIDYLVNAVRELPAAGCGHEFVIFVSPRNRHRFEHLERPNVRFENCFASNENIPVRILVQQSVLVGRMIQGHLDLIFAPGNVCPLIGSYCRVLKINTLHHYRTPELIGRNRSLYRKVAFTLSARRADRIIANSEATRREIVELIGVPSDRISVVWEASFDNYRPVPREQARSVCQRYGLQPDYILFVSTLYSYKNVETLMRAYQQLANFGQASSDLVILGRDSGSQLSKLQKFARELRIAQKTKFLGFVEKEDLPSLYSAARVFVYPSLAETFGKPLVEAMQCGVPIVASNRTAIPEVLGDAGILVNPLNAEEMAASIKSAASDENLRSRLISRGLVRGAQFSWENVAKQTILVLEQAHREWKARGLQSRPN
jgi:glycosyltransferase involved in cell wall biosynthesis